MSCLIYFFRTSSMKTFFTSRNVVFSEITKFLPRQYVVRHILIQPLVHVRLVETDPLERELSSDQVLQSRANGANNLWRKWIMSMRLRHCERMKVFSPSTTRETLQGASPRTTRWCCRGRACGPPPRRARQSRPGKSAQCRPRVFPT